jgi:hypothetical protein
MMICILIPSDTKYRAKFAPTNPAAPVIRIGFFNVVTLDCLI